MSLLDYQWSFGGITAGPGTPYRVMSIDGLRSMPELVVSDNPRLRKSGIYANGDSLAGRTLTISLLVTGSSSSDFETNLTVLELATIPVRPGQTGHPFIYKQPSQGQRRFLAANPRKRVSLQEPTYIRRWQKVNLQLVCPDPAQYDDDLTTTVVSSTGSIANAGNLESFPVVTITPSGDPVGIVNMSNNTELVLTAGIGGAIPSPCIIDLQQMTVVDSIGTNRFDVVNLSAGSFPFLSPGANALTITNASTSWAWRSAWI